jgi:hypothetical protein
MAALCAAVTCHPRLGGADEVGGGHRAQQCSIIKENSIKKAG